MKILIAGDSWGAGVWRRYSEKAIHTVKIHGGLQVFLTEYGHDVTNLSVSGASNFETLKVLEKIDLKKYDYIFVFYTNPLRDLRDKTKLSKYINVPKRSLSQQSLEKIFDGLSIDFFNDLCLLNKPMHFFGGHNKIDIKHVKCDNIKILITSLREWFYPNYTQDLYNGIYQDRWFRQPSCEHILEKLDLPLLDAIINYEDKTNQMISTQKEFFYPDDYHLNAAGHKRLADFLQAQIQNNSLP